MNKIKIKPGHYVVPGVGGSIFTIIRIKTNHWALILPGGTRQRHRLLGRAVRHAYRHGAVHPSSVLVAKLEKP